MKKGYVHGLEITVTNQKAISFIMVTRRLPNLTRIIIDCCEISYIGWEEVAEEHRKKETYMYTG